MCRQNWYVSSKARNSEFAKISTEKPVAKTKKKTPAADKLAQACRGAGFTQDVDFGEDLVTKSVILLEEMGVAHSCRCQCDCAHFFDALELKTSEMHAP